MGVESKGELTLVLLNGAAVSGITFPVQNYAVCSYILLKFYIDKNESIM